MRAFSTAALLLIAALLLAPCASTEPTTDTAQQPPSEPMLADDIWWDGLEGEEVYNWTSARTMPRPAEESDGVFERVGARIQGLDCRANHERLMLQVVVDADGTLVDTRIPGDPKGDACEDMARLALFDVTWEPATIDGTPVHAVMTFGVRLVHSN
ncbi:MAG: hypothetical protein GVY15_09020 [Bacteroidetes bacterium]|jgi:hypothetical protein|nr:hypothetical protein [Bacteroidota bacterium]